MTRINQRLTGGNAAEASQDPLGTAVAAAVGEDEGTEMLAPSPAEGLATAAAAAVVEDEDTGEMAPSPAEDSDPALGDQVKSSASAGRFCSQSSYI